MSKNIYIVYETTNIINGKYYIGVHKLRNRKYLGSGIILKQAIKKYGSSNFMRETLKEFDNESSAYDFERLIVNDELIKNPNCYNIRNGGSGETFRKQHPNIGRKYSEKTYKIWSKQRSGKNNPNYGKRGKINPQSKKWVINGKMFYSQMEIAEYFGVHKQTVRLWFNKNTPLFYKY